MVASTVGKLSALLAADLSDEQAQRLGLDTLLPLRESDGPTLFCFHPPPASPGSSACWRAISARAGRLPVFSRRARRGRWPAPPASTRCASIICARCWRSSRTALLPVRVFAGRHLSPGIAARLRQRGEAVAFLGLLDTWPPETQNWAEKRPTGWIPRYWRRSTASAKRSSPPSRGKPPASCSAPSKATMPMRCGC